MKFSKLNCSAKSYEVNKDSNLMKVKLMIVHNGINVNRSDIPEEAIRDAEESVKNIPILGYVKRDDNGDIDDFDGHNMETRITDGDNGFKVETVYLEKPIGLVPESCNPRYEEVDGVNYFVVDAFIWKSYSNSAYKIVQNSEFKSVSMEIKVLDGEYDDTQDVYRINKYVYEGVTILGDSVEPGIKGANITKYSKCADYKVALEEIYKEIYSLEEGEVNTMDDNTVEEIVEVVEIEETEVVIEPVEAEIVEEVQEEIIEEVVEEKQEFSLEMFKLLFDELPKSLEEIAVKLNERFESMEVELESLKQFKEVKDREDLAIKVEEVINEFNLQEEEVETFKANALEGKLGLDELKKELFCLVGMKALSNKEKFSAKEEVVNEVKVMDVEKFSNEEVVSGVDALFLKHGFNKHV